MQDSKREELKERYLETLADIEIMKEVMGIDEDEYVLDFIASEISKERKEILERVALETRANVCDCGDEWKDSDLSVWVESELSKLTTK